MSYTGATLAPGQTATVAVATGGGYDTNLTDAQSGTDYTALATTLTFTSGGGTSQTVAVSTIDDTLVEGTEDYTVTLSNPSNGTLGTSQANTAIIDANLAPVVAPLCVWVPDNFTDFMTGTYADGYPLNIPVPTDPNGDTLTITDFTLPTNGEIWYQPNGGTFELLEASDELTITQFQTLVFRPNDNNTTEASTFSYWVDDGNGGLTQGSVELHDVAQAELPGPSVSIGDRSANTPLNSGNSIEADFIVSQEVFDAISADDGKIKVATDFQIAPFDILIPDGEQDDALTFLIDQVSVSIIIGGETFNIIVPDDGTPGSGDNTEFWAIDNNPNSPTFGIWVADVPTYEVKNADGSGQTLEQFLNGYTFTPGEEWTVVYEDLAGGNEQARFVEFSFGATSDSLLGGIDVGVLANGCADEPNLIYGSTLGDTLVGGNASDTIIGREGGDIIEGGAGDDSLVGGNDNDTLLGGEGNDTILGEGGLTDLLDWSDANGAITRTLVTSGSLTSVDMSAVGLGVDYYSNIEGIIGGGFGDGLTGNLSANILIGGGGSDTLLGGDGADTLEGGLENDSIMGEGGNDLLKGDEGDDTLLGGSGSDTLLGGEGDDYLDGQNDGAPDSLNGGDGNDNLRFDDSDGDTVNGGLGIDRLLLDDTTLDFDNASDSLFVAIEIIDLDTGGTARTITLESGHV